MNGVRRVDRPKCLLCDRGAFETTPLCRNCGRKPGEWGLPLRIWSRITKLDDCWLWTGYQIWGGYGLSMWEGKQQPVHRIVYMARHGVALTYHQQIDHLCRNRLCVNPDHLEVVDNRTNQVRGLRSALNDNKSSQYVGVTRKGRRWKAQITVARKHIFLGSFATEEEASLAYQAALAEVAA